MPIEYRRRNIIYCKSIYANNYYVLYFFYKDADSDFLSKTIKSLHIKGVTTIYHALSTSDDVQSVTHNINIILSTDNLVLCAYCT